jgi:hypothetical protein
LVACGGGGGSGGDDSSVDGGRTTGGMATCGASWGFTQPATCDLGCVEKPEAHGPQCDSYANNGAIHDFCVGTFTFDGKTGCCDSSHRQDDPSMPVYFAECQ